MLEQVQSFRVVDSDPEASLHPRDIWRHWQKHVIWDPRTYYGIMQCVGLVVVFFGFLGLEEDAFTGQHSFMGVLMIVAIAPLHWYSVHRSSSHVLTRTTTHIIILLALATILFVLQVISLFAGSSADCGQYAYRAHCEVRTFLEVTLWACIGFCLFAAYILYTQARARLHPLIAELPYAVEDEDGEHRHAGDWTDADVAEGIPDDSPEPEGQVRL